MKILKFPKGFWWGTATSAYQVEGNSDNTDWWQWEENGKTKESCEKACDYWHKFRDDHNFISELGCNTFRMGIEWSKIQPEEEIFSDENIAHYRAVLQDLKNRKIKVQMTLWWWTSPIWFVEKYGFHDKRSIKIFVRYAQKIVDELGDLIDMYQVFNEPMVPLGQGYLSGEFPPGQINPFRFFKALNNIAKAHKKTYKLIKKKYPNSLVGISYLYNFYSLSINKNNFLFIKIINRLAKWYRIDLLGNKIKNFQDYIGINYYRLGKIKFDPKKSMYAGFRIDEDQKNIMGWITYPEGIYKVIMDEWGKHHLPIYITENGIPTDDKNDDVERIEFIKNHLKFIHKAISQGADVRGYNFWSLLDNYEWLYGFKPKFGLIDVERKTLERRPRKSFYIYQNICKNNEIELE